MLQDIRVLALDQRIDSQPGQAIVARNATFEVTPRQGQIIAVAAEVGRLSLSLRSLAREEQPGEPEPGAPAAAASDPTKPAPAPGQTIAATPTQAARASEQTFVLDSDATPLLAPPNVQRETPGITVFRGRAMERVRAGSSGPGRIGRVSEPQSSESPTRGGEDQ